MHYFNPLYPSLALRALLTDYLLIILLKNILTEYVIYFIYFQSVMAKIIKSWPIELDSALQNTWLLEYLETGVLPYKDAICKVLVEYEEGRKMQDVTIRIMKVFSPKNLPIKVVQDNEFDILESVAERKLREDFTAWIVLIFDVLLESSWLMVWHILQRSSQTPINILYNPKYKLAIYGFISKDQHHAIQNYLLN